MRTTSRIVLIAAVASLLSHGIAQASIQPVVGSDLVGSRSTPAALGLTGGGVWNLGGLTLSWTILTPSDALNPTPGLWNYNYTVTRVGQGAVSHWILELTHFDEEGADLTTEWDALFGSGTEVGTFGVSGSNPGIPGDIFGVKVDSGSPLSFSTTHAPVWGDFYAKDGAAGGLGTNFAYNVGFFADTGSGLTSNQGGPPDATGPFTNWVARPDGAIEPPVIPEMSSIVAWLGLAVCGLIAVKKTRLHAIGC